MPLRSINPATEEIIASYEEISETEIDIKLSLTAESFKIWKNTKFSERAELMLNLAEIYEREEMNLAKIMTIEMGKPITQGLAEIRKCALTMRYYAENSEKFLSPETVKTEAKKVQIVIEPLGALLAIMPWNFPFWQVIRFAAPALMAGNVGILKHASNVPMCALAIEEKFLEAGFPPGVFQSFLVGTDKVEKIIRDPRVKAVALTGSEKAGVAVGRLAGEEIKKTVLELGSNDPFIVLDDADLDKAAEVGIMARLQNAGQSCIAAKRFIVVESRYEEFLNKYQANWKRVVVGDPLDEKTQVGPVNTLKSLEDLEKAVKTSVEKGAKILCGGKRLDRKGFFYEPTILTDVKKGMPAYDDEIFGPVASIIKVKDEVEAITVANDSNYGLGASVWTENLETAERVATQIETAAVFVNSMVKSDPRVPFGGVKRSGHGRELSHYGIKEFVNIKTVWIN